MESSLPLQALIAFGILFTILCLNLVMAKSKFREKKGTPPPEAAGAWPLIGHLHLIEANKLLHQTLGAMADKYGPAFSIRLGVQQALVVSSWEVAKECFTANDKVFSSRPQSLALKIMAYDHAVLGFAPYGPYWRNLRKLAVIELLSSHRLEMFKHIRDSEINIFMKEVYEKWVGDGDKNPVLVEMKGKFGDLVMNVVLRIIVGKRYTGSGNEELRRFQKAINEFILLIGIRMISDAIPLLGWLDVLNGYRGKMKRSAREMDCVLGEWLEEHRRKRLTGRIDEGERDFVDVMLSVMEEEEEGGNSHRPHDTDTVVKATCLSMILGGSDTTGVSLTWALSLLLNNRHVLKKAQEELDVHVGKHRLVDESDTKNLVYLQAIVKETLRLYPALPMSVPRIAMEDCIVAGFHVPAGTHLLVNLSKLQRDPSIWSNPLEFRPERFLTDQMNLDVRGQNFEFIPFGSGRRMCPGITFALQVLQLTLARLLQGFELGTVSDSQVDMTESLGLTAPKATPLEVLLTPRLSSVLYTC
ncbi:Cytochrome P450 82C2 like [Actinidia chinensis var. chinensis]|uniref:Cytochrome P450 82C2 like n=1 Tax=Actinidia chinensis var. chinensis TaxID=1590841 RepID=A0A2R6RBX2_ACTCC|nr:Cytochrome P450 82C2 like [Actinidia chinensis var. chinensis]